MARARRARFLKVEKAPAVGEFITGVRGAGAKWERKTLAGSGLWSVWIDQLIAELVDPDYRREMLDLQRPEVAAGTRGRRVELTIERIMAAKEAYHTILAGGPDVIRREISAAADRIAEQVRAIEEVRTKIEEAARVAARAVAPA